MGSEQENKNFSDDVGEQNFEQQNGDTENGGNGEANENGQESQEDR